MNKLLLLLLLIPNIVIAKTCFIHNGKNAYSALQACNDGDQLHFYLTKFGSKNNHDSTPTLGEIKNSYCDLGFETNIEEEDFKSTLTCTFKNNLKK